MPLRRRYFVFLLGKMLCICLLGPFDSVLFKSVVSLLIFCLDEAFIIESRVSKSPAVEFYLFLSSVLLIFALLHCDIGCMFICKCSVFLMNLQYTVTLFVACDRF